MSSTTGYVATQITPSTFRNVDVHSSPTTHRTSKEGGTFSIIFRKGTAHQSEAKRSESENAGIDGEPPPLTRQRYETREVGSVKRDEAVIAIIAHEDGGPMDSLHLGCFVPVSLKGLSQHTSLRGALYVALGCAERAGEEEMPDTHSENHGQRRAPALLRCLGLLAGTCSLGRPITVATRLSYNKEGAKREG